jgi:hypothetical protein
MVLESRIRNGVSWFYWIAGFSVINSIISASGSKIVFVIGLGITRVINAIIMELSKTTPPSSAINILTIFGFLFELLLAGLFVIFGIFGQHKYRIAIIIGLVVYGLDCLILIIFNDWWALAFHCFAIYSIWSGYRAIEKMKELEKNGPIQVPGNVSIQPPFSSKKVKKQFIAIFIVCIVVIVLTLTYWIATGAK